MFGGSGISLADIAAVTKGNNNNGDGLGGNNGWWVQNPNCCQNPWEQFNNRGCGGCCNG